MLVLVAVNVENPDVEGVAVKGKHEELDAAPLVDVVPEGHKMGYRVFKGQ